MIERKPIFGLPYSDEDKGLGLRDQRKTTAIEWVHSVSSGFLRLATRWNEVATGKEEQAVEYGWWVQSLSIEPPP